MHTGEGGITLSIGPGWEVTGGATKLDSEVTVNMSLNMGQK